MEFGSQGSNDSSSEENDRQVQVKDDAGTARRSYECTFCKRGFTNAQALGGHMNIHRKDRAKDKRQHSGSSISSKPMNEDFMNPRYIPAISSSETSRFHPVLEAQRNYGHVYLQPPMSSPRYPYSYHDNHLINSRSQSTSMNDEFLGANLSLRIGSGTHVGNEVRRAVGKEDEVDLELRLGHDP
ncbi:hypothetical protein CFOL_v3_24669 [Cephalotus follicularis]|uniref:C2H2-type domain-containing protein n=1 Tax=Cephalotus follicularis TaxID=3775 RepID=A0A1Q3CLT0_CEPFO|nr:hypothetical protein CFOL_v3_24669 [Cephalotus follicularis]